jgi:hypothetical protein
MANSGLEGWGALGHTLAGGNAPDSAIAEAQGMSLGANTQAAIEKAHGEQQKQHAIAQLNDPEYQNQMGLTSEQGTRMGLMVAAGRNPDEAAQMMAKDRETKARSAIMDPATSAANRYSAGASIDPGILAHPWENLGDGMIGNAQNPDTGIQQTPVSKSIAAAHNAEAQLHTAEATTPEKFHPQTSMMLANNPAGADDMAWALHNGYTVPSPRQGGMQIASALRKQDEANQTTGGGFTIQDQKAAVKSFAPGGTNGQQLQFVDRATGHLRIYDQLVDALHNGDVQAGNSAMAALKNEFGSAAPANINTAAPFIIGEIMRSMAGANAGTLEERQPLIKELGTAQAPNQAHTNANTLRMMVREQALALQNQYRHTGRGDFTNGALQAQNAKDLNLKELQQGKADAAPASEADPLGIR